MNLPRVYMCSPSWTPLPLPSHPIPLGHPSAPASSTLYYASHLDWRFISYMIIYTFKCHSPVSSHPHPLPQSPKDCSIHLCLFCYLEYRVIINIFLNSIYMHEYTVLVLQAGECRFCSEATQAKGRTQHSPCPWRTSDMTERLSLHFIHETV